MPDTSATTRYLGSRINGRVQLEDYKLVAEVQRGLASNSYPAGVLSEKEIVVHGFHEWIRNAIPVARIQTVTRSRRNGTSPPSGSSSSRA